MEGSKLPTIRIGGREIPLFYSTFEMIEIQKELKCTAFQLNVTVFGIEKDEEDDDAPVRFTVITDAEKQAKLGTLIRIQGNAGLEESGQEADLTAKWVLRRMKPTLIMGYALAAMAEINEGNRIEQTGTENQGPVDELLEEQQAKKQPGN